MRRSLPFAAIVVFAGALAAACSGGGTQPLVDTSVTGSWSLAATIADTFSTARTTCTLGGNVTLAQAGALFSGQLTGSTRSCTGPGATTGAFNGAVVDGLVAGDTVAFRTTTIQCTYTGTASSLSAPTRVVGSAFCILPRGSSTVPYSGTFTLTH